MNVSHDHFAVVNSLNLDRIKLKLMHVESGEGWDRARADAAEAEYRRFLYLTRKYPEERIAPSVEVDTFWHYHILDTLKYAEDCNAVFGGFLHHDPYVGIGEGTSPADQVRAGNRMRELHAAEFGASGATDTAWCTFSTEHARVTGADMEVTASAWCTVTSAQSGTAWCTVTASKAKMAWCTVTAPEAKMAWCTVTAREAKMAFRTASGPGSKTAWCTVTAPQTKTAWCTVTALQAKTAWCTVTAPSAKAASRTFNASGAQAAWCTVTAPEAKFAWCTVTGSKASNATRMPAPSQSKAAWCTVTATELRDERAPALEEA